MGFTVGLFWLAIGEIPANTHFFQLSFFTELVQDTIGCGRGNPAELLDICIADGRNSKKKVLDGRPTDFLLLFSG